MTFTTDFERLPWELRQSGPASDKASYGGVIGFFVVSFAAIASIFLVRHRLRRRREQRERAEADAFDLQSWSLHAGSRMPSRAPRTVDYWQPRFGSGAFSACFPPQRDISGHGRDSQSLADNGFCSDSGGLSRLSFASRVLATLCIPDEEIGGNAVCPICLQALNRKARRAPCGHTYHLNCIKNWVAKVKVWHCPSCVADEKAGGARQVDVGSVQLSRF
jgi:Ring finger domain